MVPWFKLDRKAAGTARDISNAFGPGIINERTTQWWFKKFCSSDESLEDDKRSGWPSDVDNDQLRALVETNPRTTVQELASELDVTYVTISNHLKEVGKTKILEKWVLHEFNDNQKKKKNTPF
ncbi:histone-lysine N-methyltransferase SETMAR-like [Octopus bimaculoides]|uniref:histone-lysine N-methyltransferase SETMAR-like n=1 Tax=Octopus bimaculoides TaxID=37653 RepID=UPI0022E30C63|nr:histone-lysine N-methyltransferase SETMAR-like [Octopus bimaculoides]